MKRLKVLAATIAAALLLAATASAHPLIRTGSQSHISAAAKTVTSENWSGYAWVGKTGSFHSITTHVQVPGPFCSLSSDDGLYPTDTAEWTGLDGFDDDTVEQNGLDQVCDAFGVASYDEWYELYPAYPVYGPAHPQPGSVLTLETSYDRATGVFRFQTGSWIVYKRAAVSVQRDSVEVITEAPFDGEVMPTTPFATIPFTADPLLHHGTEYRIVLNDPTDGSTITPSPIADNAFTVAWTP